MNCPFSTVAPSASASERGSRAKRGGVRLDLEPALDHDLAVCEEVDRVRALPVQVAKERVFHAAERERRNRRRDPDVHADVTGMDAILEITRVAAIRREDR